MCRLGNRLCLAWQPLWDASKQVLAKIIAVNINAAKEKIARESGATAFCNPKEYDESIQNARKR